MKILLIEDEEEIALFTKKGLEAELFAVDVANEGEKGEYMARTNDYDIIIIDYNLPYKNGIEVCKNLRDAGRKFPILMLTAEKDVGKKVEAFANGANDYLTKPFAIEELIARVRALLRHNSQSSSTEFSYKDVIIDLEKHIVIRAQKVLSLRKKEMALLEYFLRNPGTILTRSMILEHVWDTNADPFTNTVDVHVRSLRKKMNIDNLEPLIETVRGIGYRI
ncbi:MAG TPA: DNA-binding response regulator [Candidatus Moranbacteria bacterium]|nr:DNA-binding response regulator [Candidatus Moranbacteria bacterium]